MGNWFGKKESHGGSTILPHGNTDIALVGDPSPVEFTETREGVYKELLGEALSVSHENVPRAPHVDIYTFRRRGLDRRDVFALVTGGMSNFRMNIPTKAAEADAPSRVELIFYCSEPRQEYIDTLRWLAHFPHDYKTWVGSGHTIPNGTPPAPLWGSSVLDTILLMPTIVKRDATLPDILTLGGDPVHFLWVVPLITAECNLKLAKGLNAILGLFAKHRHPHVFDPNRAGYV